MLLALFAATAFGLQVVLAAFSFKEGANAVGYLLVLRFILAIGLIALCRFDQKPIVPKISQLKVLMVAVATMCIFSFFHFKALEMMPVALVTIFIRCCYRC